LQFPSITEEVSTWQNALRALLKSSASSPQSIALKTEALWQSAPPIRRPMGRLSPPERIPIASEYVICGLWQVAGNLSLDPQTVTVQGALQRVKRYAGSAAVVVIPNEQFRRAIF